MRVRTADLHLVPQLRLALLTLPLVAGTGRTLDRTRTAVALCDDLAGVHEAVRLQTRAPRVILGCICYAWRR
jgi:hypothetical protein